MDITHVSDLHGNLAPLADVYWPSSLWIFTGDIFPNLRPLDRESEARYQRAWFRRNANAFRAAIRGVPVLCVDGNHDFVSLAQLLTEHGIAAHFVTPDGCEIGGRRFAGYGEIPAMGGFWSGEADDETLARLTARTFASNPDVLVTHCPPFGTLDAGYGNRPLADRLRGAHGVTTHLFGHIHEHAGDVTTADVRYINGALGARMVTL